MNTLHKRLQASGKNVINPFPTQVTGMMFSLVIFILAICIFETLLLRWYGGWVWIARVILVLISVSYIYKSFYKAGLQKEPIPPGFCGVPRNFGKPNEEAVYTTGRVWQFPGKGFEMVLVDMRSRSLELKIHITTKDTLKMVCPLVLNYVVYNPHLFIEIKDFEKSFQGKLSEVFIELSSSKTAAEMLQLGREKILTQIINKIKSIPPVDNFQIKDFGIEIQDSTIAVNDGFDFVDQKTRDIYESVGQEKKQKEAQTEELDHLVTCANKMVTASGDTLPFREAFLKAQQMYGKGAPNETIYHLSGLFSEDVLKFLSGIRFFNQQTPNP